MNISETYNEDCRNTMYVMSSCDWCKKNRRLEWGIYVHYLTSRLENNVCRLCVWMFPLEVSNRLPDFYETWYNISVITYQLRIIRFPVTSNKNISEAHNTDTC
jgi:hypothetical protein